MKVLKFGGTSVGSAAALLNVKQIVSERNEDIIVVVSALSKVTDMLIKLAETAERDGKEYKEVYENVCKRHFDLIDELFPQSKVSTELKASLQVLLTELEALCDGINMLKVLPERTKNQIVSLGERMSSRIVSALLEADLYESLTFIKTTVREGKTVLDAELTDNLVKDAFKDFRSKDGKWNVAVAQGFISTDSEKGFITNLGRGGSDYTASIIAAALDADILEIWTDVDGFMTADPRIIKTSYVIDELSFAEAMELCNFGAKVVYAPALYPVYPKDIPVIIKNTFNPSAKGTTIRRNITATERTLTGITSIENISLITLSAPSMAGIVGVDGRLFSALSRKEISVFMVSQSSSETGITIGVSSNCDEKASNAINEEFASEIQRGVMNKVHLERDLAAVAVVGEGLKYSNNIAGKLFTTMGRNGISVLACAQGSSEYNISMIVEKKFLRKSLNVIHDSFFLSEYKELNLFICGIGTVGGNLISQIASQRQKLMEEHDLKLNIVGIARSSKGIFSRDGIDLENYREIIDAEGVELTPTKLRDEVVGMNIFNSVFVDCTASAEIAGLYKDFFENGISVVAANKIAASSDYENYVNLKQLARKNGVKYLFETNVGAGLPVINTINALRNSGDHIEKIEAVVSGTLNYIFNTISEDVPFSETVRRAKELGFSEPDPRIDLSGKDVIRKLVILSREAGYKVNQEDVDADLFIPADFFDCSIDEFWKKLPSLDEDFEKRRKKLVQEGKHWRFVAKMENGKFSVSLGEFSADHSFYNLEGSNNIILITTERYHEHPMLIQGYGAGASVTAAGVFADIMSIANV